MAAVTSLRSLARAAGAVASAPSASVLAAPWRLGMARAAGTMNVVQAVQVTGFRWMSVATEAAADGLTQSTLPPNLKLHHLSEIAPTQSLPYLDDPVKQVDIRVFGQPGQVAGTVLLDNGVFGVPIRKDLVHRVIKWQLSCRRTTLYKTKTISEVSGGGRKPWKQKTLGRARAGSTRAPQWRHGAKVMGPVFRDWSTSLQKKVRVAGLKVALAAKYRDHRLFVVDELSLDTYKTKSLHKLLQEHGWAKMRVVFMDAESFNSQFVVASGNLERVTLLPTQGANVYDLVKADALVVTKAALDALYSRLLLTAAERRELAAGAIEVDETAEDAAADAKTA